MLGFLEIVALLGLSTFSEDNELIKLSTFNSCEGEFNVTEKACTIIHNEISKPNWESILIDGKNGGFLRFPQKSMCPFNGVYCNNDKFTYFGWVKFYEYPECGNVAAYVTSPQFDIHLLPNGHLRVNVRYQPAIAKKLVQVESLWPVLLDEWYALVLQVDFSKGQNSIKLFVNKKLYTDSKTAKSHVTKKNPPKNFLLGTDGQRGGFIKMEVSFAYFANHVMNFDAAWEKLTSEKLLTIECSPKYKMVSAGPFQCYFFPSPNYMLSYKSHESNCKAFGNYFGYPLSRQLKITNMQIWKQFIVPKIEKLSSRFDYKFWVNVDQLLLEEKIFPLKKMDEEFSEQGNDTCTIMDTTMEPWSLVETSCNSEHAIICEQSWDCLSNNPCQNDGLCQQTEEGAICHCFDGTSGKFCENGKPIRQLTNVQNCNMV